jgi:putative SOS response-associated peptidase YedK
MCGRFVTNFVMTELTSYLEQALQKPVKVNDTNLPVMFNAAPSQLIPIIIAGAEAAEIQIACWGLTPPWLRAGVALKPLINARAESVHEKPSFRDLIANNRCVVPMRGFYEWGTTPAKSKIPFYIRRQDGEPAMVAGLYSRLDGPEAEQMFVVITREASDDVVGIHHRSPAILEFSEVNKWLYDGEPPLDLATTLCRSRLQYHPVSTRVNNARNQGEDLVTPVDTGQLF